MAVTSPVAAAPAPPGAADPALLEALAALTPEARLRWNDGVAATILELRHGFAAAEPDDAAGPPGRQRR
jgi:hypothetical protein